MGGAGLVVLHTRRTMKSYNFTDSDLDTISLSNVVSSVAFAFAAGIATFCIDLNKDVLLSPTVPALGTALQVTVNWLGIPAVIVLAAVGIAAQLKRGSVIRRVKEGSVNVIEH